MRVRDRAAEVVAANWRIRGRLPRITRYAHRTGAIRRREALCVHEWNRWGYCTRCSAINWEAVS